MSKITQLTVQLSNNVLTNSQLKNTKGRGNGNAYGHNKAVSNFTRKGKCPPPFENDMAVSESISNTILN